MSKLHTHYDNLKVARDAPIEVIRAAYRSLCQKFHPDKNPGDAQAAKVMAVINQSYDVLSDPDRRRQHDDWIRAHEVEETGKRTESASYGPSTTQPPGIRMPEKGSALFSDLTDAAKERIRARVRNQRNDQDCIPLKGVRWNYFWAVIFSAWFIYVFYQASQVRWENETAQIYRNISAVVAILVATNIKSIHAWYYKPLRPSLIVTPLYIIQTDAERIWYWPLNEVKNFSATHHFRNGSYQYTAVSVFLGGKAKDFSISPQRAYSDFVRRFTHYLGMLQQIASRSEQAYVDANDDFKGVRPSAPGTLKSWGVTSAFLIAAVVASLGLSAIANAINGERPAAIHPIYSRSSPQPTSAPTYSPSGPVNAQATSAKQVDYIKAELGRLPPDHAGYISGQEDLNTDGLSKVTVDNSQNESDVLVKLVFIQGASAYPVRVFFIPGHGKFTVNDVRVGNYDIRYLDRWSGAMSRSESFELEEIDTGNGIQYSTITMTLYKVANGNMQTYAIDAKDF